VQPAQQVYSSGQFVTATVIISNATPDLLTDARLALRLTRRQLVRIEAVEPRQRLMDGQTAYSWLTDTPLTIQPGQRISLTMPIGRQVEPGLWRLWVELMDARSWTLAAAFSDFFVVPTQAELILTANPTLVHTSYPITLTGLLVNSSSSYLDAQTMEIMLAGRLIQLLGPFDLPPGGHYAFTSIITAPARPGIFAVEARWRGLSAFQSIAAAQPRFDQNVQLPELVGDELFTLTVTLTNTGLVTGYVDMTAPRWQESISLPPRRTVQLQRQYAISRTTAFAIAFTEDLTATVTREVIYGLAVAASFSPAPIYWPGPVQIPYAITNTGYLPITFPLTITLESFLGSDSGWMQVVDRLADEPGSRVIATRTLPVSLLPGGVLHGTLHFNLNVGTYGLGWESRHTSGWVWFEVRLPLSGMEAIWSAKLNEWLESVAVGGWLLSRWW